jgi:FixJ family two-component response regulator
VNAIPVILYIVDDDPDVRRALARLLLSAGYTTRSFSSAGEFLVSGEAHLSAGCIILDLAMPGLNGLELQEHLAVSACHRPIIFLTGNGDISKSVRAMKAGAVNFLTKPVDDHELLQAVQEALKVDESERALWSSRRSVSERIHTLTPRERQVFDKVVAGLLNKQIAAELGIVEKTIKVHRARMMRKMNATSLVELVHLASLVGVHVWPVSSEPEPERGVDPNIRVELEAEHSNY